MSRRPPPNHPCNSIHRGCLQTIPAYHLPERCPLGEGVSNSKSLLYHHRHRLGLVGVEGLLWYPPLEDRPLHRRMFEEYGGARYRIGSRNDLDDYQAGPLSLARLIASLASIAYCSLRRSHLYQRRAGATLPSAAKSIQALWGLVVLSSRSEPIQRAKSYFFSIFVRYSVQGAEEDLATLHRAGNEVFVGKGHLQNAERITGEIEIDNRNPVD